MFCRSGCLWLTQVTGATPNKIKPEPLFIQTEGVLEEAFEGPAIGRPDGIWRLEAM
jgi:hypothetical protein